MEPQQNGVLLFLEGECVGRLVDSHHITLNRRMVREGRLVDVTAKELAMLDAAIDQHAVIVLGGMGGPKYKALSREDLTIQMVRQWL